MSATSKRALRFWLFQAIALLFVTPLYFIVKEHAPIAHAIISFIAQVLVYVVFFRWIYEHWDDK
jgi:hypothetical protein